MRLCAPPGRHGRGTATDAPALRAIHTCRTTARHVLSAVCIKAPTLQCTAPALWGLGMLAA